MEEARREALSTPCGRWYVFCGATAGSPLDAQRRPKGVSPRLPTEPFCVQRRRPRVSDYTPLLQFLATRHSLTPTRMRGPLSPQQRPSAPRHCLPHAPMHGSTLTRAPHICCANLARAPRPASTHPAILSTAAATGIVLPGRKASLLHSYPSALATLHTPQTACLTTFAPPRPSPTCSLSPASSSAASALTPGSGSLSSDCSSDSCGKGGGRKLSAFL